MATNNILPFCPTDIATNLLTDGDYLAATDRTSGNKPGVASARLNNKALRQSSAVAAGVAQFFADNQTTDINDALTPSQVAAVMGNAVQGRLIAIRIITTTQTYVPTTGTRSVVVTVVGGGGGGGGAQTTPGGQWSAGAGGGGGGWAKKRISSGFSGANITIGIGGAGSGGGAGSSGGTSSFGVVCSATGGAGGSFGNAGSFIGANGFAGGGLGSGGDLNGAGGRGNYAMYSSGPTSGAGGFSILGDGAAWVTASGGPVNGNSATTAGSGGSGGANPASGAIGASGGNGANGACIVEEYA